jgi:hypothetical protein
MKILFLGRNQSYFRNFESVIRELAARGHDIHLVVEHEDGLPTQPIVSALTSEFRSVTSGMAPSRTPDDWTWMASRLRLGLDYLRYQHRLFDDTPKLRDRARQRTPGAFVALGDAIRRVAPWLRKPVSSVVRRLERAVPDDPAIRAFIEAERPDVVLLTPLIDLGSSQIDYLRAARSLGIPTAICVWSWDHLSSKALIREWPDRVFVWNDVQKREAIELHNVPPARIVVTGAQCFDKWFDRQPSRDRETFCAEVGLPAARPFILWVGSALFHGSPSEAALVVDWVRRLRMSDAAMLRDAPILIRPHPSRLPEWNAIDLSGFENVVVWMGAGSPIDKQSRNDYFDSLYHSALVAGLNTSAFIEAGIIGRPVHTILLPEFYENQMGTVHFRYLLETGGGLLNAARSFEEHLSLLDEALTTRASAVRPFIRTFVRPRGLDRAATPIFVDSVEQMAALTPHTSAADRFALIERRLLAGLAGLRHRQQYERWTHSERELEGIVRLRGARAEKERQAEERMAARAAVRQARESAADARRAEKRARSEAARAAKAAKMREKQQAREARQSDAPVKDRMRARRPRSARIKNLIKQKLGWV